MATQQWAFRASLSFLVSAVNANMWHPLEGQKKRKEKKSCQPFSSVSFQRQPGEVTWEGRSTLNVLQIQGRAAVHMLVDAVKVSPLLQPLVLLLDVVQNLLWNRGERLLHLSAIHHPRDKNHTATHSWYQKSNATREASGDLCGI